MLKKLRIKIVAVIMLVVTTLFVVIFLGIFHFTKLNMQRESIQMMRAMSFKPNDIMPMMIPDDNSNKIKLPFFNLTLDDKNQIISADGGYYDLTDKELLQKLVNYVLNSNEQIGMIPEYDLRFLVTEYNSKRTIVFADISSEKTMINGLIKNCIVIGTIGYTVFFLMSLFLARLVTKPVERTWNEQKQFIADASHELKTPLTVIITNAEMLEDTGYSEADKLVFTKNILWASKRMRGLVESLLELARMDNKITSGEMKKLNYSKLVSNSILPFEPLFFEKNTELSTNITSDITVIGNKNKLCQVISILLDNALKYCDSAYPVKLNLSRMGTHAVLSVSGKGTPLSKSDCKKIFKRFYRVDQSRTDSESYGLGLSIAESIIKEHDGKIWAESENGVNSFFVSLNSKNNNL